MGIGFLFAIAVLLGAGDLVFYTMMRDEGESSMERKKPATPATVDEYISGFPHEVAALLEAYRAAIREAAPEAEEGISYGMPAYKLGGPLVYFGAHKAHVGLYALPRAIEVFADRLAGLSTSKGAIQFPFDREPPLDLVRDIVRFRVEENRARLAARRAGADNRRA
jgi:uncharacterized protein YdhG (YjbR/CyaY superfamily)